MITPASRGGAGTVWPAIAQVLAGVVLFSCSDTMAKYLRGTLPSVEIAWLRYVVFLLIGLMFAARRRFVGLAPKRPWLQVLRGVMVVGSALFFITGLSYLPMAEAAAISFVSPAFITALSVLLLREQVGLHRWTATIVGLVGVIIVIRPGGDALQLSAFWPLASAACWAGAMIATRLIGTQDRSETTLLWTAAVGLILLTMGLPFAFVPPTKAEVGLGLLLGVTASTGQYLVILAYRRATASILAPFSYLQLLSSALLGWLVFGSVPDSLAYVGASVIVASGMYIVYRERLRSRSIVVKTDAAGAPARAGEGSSENSSDRPAPAR